MADGDGTTTTPPATDGTTTAPPAPPTPPASAGGSELGDAGKKALDEERAARREAERQRKELEARLKDLEPLAAKAKELEDSKKTETEKLSEKLTAAEKRAADAEQKALRLEVAAAKGLTDAQAKRLVGTTKQELEADADELLASFGANGDGAGKKGSGRKPVEQLRPGGAPNPPNPTLQQQIAALEKEGKWGEAQALKAQQLMQLANPNQ
ncbi:hypothetical protein [Streptomyces sp. HGB0020]|uniref:hypothetical protein n=1 Tax=Streptomyces sp. HGB0020 TaxID=1078086 RepID=UPI00034E433D|nr:hypothetical protein [Streptomyces sp. HGB0020]EPD63171.1 hypothetical protein HMPREF1211_03512 [Streptomyces sp. HGB0020]